MEAFKNLALFNQFLFLNKNDIFNFLSKNDFPDNLINIMFQVSCKMNHTDLIESVLMIYYDHLSEETIQYGVSELLKHNNQYILDLLDDISDDDEQYSKRRRCI
jgi:transcription elongation factor GreA-like protein